MLIAGRALRGLFAALVVPTALALLLHAWPPGTTTGALLIEVGSWRWVLLVNVPLGVLVPLAGGGLLRESGDPVARGPPDPAGALLVAAIPALLSFSVIQGPSWGWDDPWVVAVLLLPVLGRRSATARFPDR